MANPVPYQQLFDIDGLNAAIRECEGAADQFSAAVTEDFKRINTSVQAIRKSIEALNASMGSRTIKLVDESSQEAIVAYAKQVVDLTKQVRDQQTAITNLNEVINANKVAISDAKVAAEQFKTEQQNLKAQQEATKLSIVQQTLSLEQQKQALTDSKLATQQAVQGQQQNKNAISASNLANQQYISTIKQNQAAQAALNTQIAQNRLQISNLALANKQAAQAQTAATGSYNEAVAKLKALGNQIKSMPGEFNQATDAGKALVKQYNELNTELKKFDAAMGNHQRNVGNYKSVLGSLQDELKAYAANMLTIAAAIKVIKETFELALSTDATRTSLGYILGNTELADMKLRALKETANRLGIEFVSTAKAYALFTGAAKASNFSLDEADKIFNSVARASGILHLSAEQTSNAFYALQEMISKGTIQSKELQRQLGQAIPGAVQIMADAVGVSVQKLHEMEKAGELLTADVLPKFAAQLDKTFAPGVNSVDSLQASVNRLKNTFSEAVDENTAINQFFKNIFNNINNIASSITKTVNSTSWQEFWLRFKPAFGQQSIDKNLNAANLLHDLQAGRDNSFKVSAESDPFVGGGAPLDKVKKRVDDLKIALVEAANTYNGLLVQVGKGGKHQIEEGGDLTLPKLKQTYDTIKSLLNLYKQEYPKAFETVKKSIFEAADFELNSVAEIRKRIDELSKLPGSATKGSEINLRIDALKKRLHDLQPDLKKAKDGFEILEERIKKAMLALQDSIIRDYAKHQGKESANTKQLAADYQNLYEKLLKLQKLRDDAVLNVRRDQQIVHYGSLFPQNTRPQSLPDLTVDSTKRGSKSTLGNELQVSQDNIDVNAGERDLDAVVTKYAKANTAIANSFKQRNLSKLEYDSELLANETSQANEEYFIQANILNKQLEIAKITYGEDSKQYSAVLAQKAKLDEAYAQKSLKLFIQTEEKKREALKETIALLSKNADVTGASVNNPGLSKLLSDTSSDLINGIGKPDAFQETAKLGMDAISTYTDFAINASKQRQAQFEQEMGWEIQGAGTNALAKQKIEREYTQKIKDEKTKQAKLAKAAAAVEIILNTAIAVSKTLAQTAIFGIPLIPIIIGLGAVELGIVLASPIPQFEKGRDSGPATLAEVNEKGPEALVKNGKVRFANKGQRGYTYLQKDEKVLRADETAALINNQIYNAEHVSKSKATYDTWIATQSGNAGIDYDKMGQVVSGAVSKLPLEQNIWNEQGHARYRRTQNAKIKSVRDRNRI